MNAYGSMFHLHILLECCAYKINDVKLHNWYRQRLQENRDQSLQWQVDVYHLKSALSLNYSTWRLLHINPYNNNNNIIKSWDASQHM